jgi:hypothetical protein
MTIFDFGTLAKRFLDEPYEFFVEKDIQRFAEFEILKTIADRKLLHQEYPMPVKNKKEMANIIKKGRPHLDMSILNLNFFNEVLKTEFHPNLQDNKAAVILKDRIQKPWIDCGVEFKFFRYAATKVKSLASGLTTSKFIEIIWDFEKLSHYSSEDRSGRPLISLT